jgi:two-component system, LuxR family, response regulator FixJ
VACSKIEPSQDAPAEKALYIPHASAQPSNRALGFVMSTSPDKPVIYVVDDDPGVLGSLRFLLEADGFEVETFRSGPALLKSVAPNDADCFVIDYKMPNIDGIELAIQLHNRGLAVPIILITGHLDDSIPARAAFAGVHHVLLKPHLEESLAAWIRDAIQEASLYRRPHCR